METATVDNGLEQFRRPDHVPPELIIPFDMAHGPEVMAFPPGAHDEIRKTLPVFYSSLYGGFWVFTRYADIRAAFQNHELFCQDEGLPRAPYGKLFKPLMVDPPVHTVYRKIMAPIFAPPKLRALEPVIRQTVRMRLEEIAPKGQTQFASEFSLSIASAMFCGLLDLPLSEFSFFHSMSFGLIYGTNTVWKEKGEAAAKQHRLDKINEIQTFLGDLLPKRKANPGSDILSTLFLQQIDGQPISDQEVLDMATLVFFAGTDSTAGSVSYAHAYLAKHTDLRAKLIANIDDDNYVWNAAEELNRYHGFHHMTRTATRDAEFAGVQIKAGDQIVLPTQAANHDPEMFPDPLKVDFERPDAKKNLTFGAGIHRCLGSSLATSQLRIALQEVHRTIPDYRLVGEVEYASGGQKIVPHVMNLEFTPVTGFKA